MPDASPARARRALLIGINDYPRLRKLAGCVNDVRLMREVLQENFGFPAGNITVLEDAEATRERILAAFDALIASTGTNDLVVFHYAGHGSQMTDLEYDEPSGLDSTIQPYDTEGWQGDNRDITDDEINLKLEALAEKTSYLTLIFDSCHSGTITRDAMGATARSSPADRRPASELGRKPVPGVGTGTPRKSGPSGWLPLNEKMVVVSGCRDEELSQEYYPPEGNGKLTHGALTWFLIGELRGATAGTTWRDVFERVAARVNANNSAQHPQMEGKADRVIFGVHDIVPTRFLRVTARDGDMVTLSAGAAQGVTVGSVYGVHVQGTKDPKGSTPIGEVEVIETGVVTSQARITSESGDGAITPDARAFETRHAFGDFRLNVSIAAPPGAAATLRALLDASTLVTVVDDKHPAAITVLYVPARALVTADEPIPRAGPLREPMWATIGETGDLLTKLKRTGDEATVVANLETLARYRQALALDNPDPDSALRGKFTLELLKRNADGTWVKAEPEVAGGQVVYTEGDAIGFRVESKHDAAVHLALIDFGITGAITPLRPPPGAPASQEPLRANGTYDIGPKMKDAPTVTWETDADFIDSVDHGREAEAIETVKLFITEQPADFSVLRQKGVRSDKRRSSLGTLLHDMFQGPVTRGIRMAPESREDWTTVSRSFVVRRRTTQPLSGNTTPVSVGNATIVAPGMSGTVRTHLGKKGREEADRLLDSHVTAALAESGMEVAQTVEIAGAQEVGPASRGAGDQPAFEVRLPEPREGFGQLVMASDELGVVSWHFAEATRAPGMRGAITTGTPTRTFVIPRGVPAEAAAGAPASRGIVGALGQKFLKEIVFPLVDPVIGEVSEAFVNRLEQRKWPYRVRAFNPGDYTLDAAPEIAGEGWSRLSGGRALLMVHGTFSRSHLAFAQLPKAAMEQLHGLYGGRVLAFDHFTLSHDPRENVRRFLAQVPEGTALDLDIICHSRGGLVSRMLSEKQGEFSLGSRRLRVGKVVFVGAPNAGTALADPRHMDRVLDVFTNLLNFFPGAGVGDVLAMILGVLKQVAIGALAGLDGLQAMNPDGEFVKWMNTGDRAGDTRYFTVAADVKPSDQGLRHFMLTRGLQKVLGGANDLVVPTQGVLAAGPIEDSLVLEGTEAVSHTKYFDDPTVQQRIIGWLSKG